MRTRTIYTALAIILFTLVSTVSSRAQSEERLCDTAFEDCRVPLWSLIDNETVGIDIAYWFMQDTSIANKVIARWQAGVPVRILVDPRANPTYAGNEQILNQFKAAGIPMRFKHGGGILHWKMMLFVGQNRLEFTGANYGASFFVPTTPNVNYIDEAIYFTDDVSLIQSFKTKYDDLWTDTINYSDYGNITGPLTRKYPTFPIDPEMNFPPSIGDSEDFYNRTALNFNQETQKIDIIMYRITNQRYTDTTIAAVNRGIPVRLIHEPDEYRNPARQWDSWNVDRMYMAGVQIKMRKHIGLNHQKSVILYGKGMTIFGSSNWTGPSSNSQAEHNYFTVKPFFFNWFVDQFERKWNSTTENQPFVPLGPDEPSYLAPANGAVAQPTTLTLRWEGGRWAHKYDIYFGTSPNPPLLVSDVSTSQSGAVGGQPLLNKGSVDDGVTEEYTLPITLTPGTTYFWRVVGKTMANISANGQTWSFVTAGSESAPSAPTGLAATAIAPTRIDLSWTDTSSETGYRVERSPNGSSGWTEIASPSANQTSYSDLQVSAQQTYFYRVRGINSGGFSPYSNVANATTPSPPPPSSSDVVLWAAEAPVKVGAWSVVADGSAAGGSRLANPDAGAPKKGNASANPSDYFEMTFDAQAGVDYRLWLRSRAHNDFWGNDSVFIQFSDSVNSSGTPVFRIGTNNAADMNLEDCSGCGLQGWGWQDNGWGIGVLGPLIRFQSSGTHTIRIQVREDGLSIDQIVLSSQTYLNSAPGPLKNDATILPKSSGGGGPVNPAPVVSSVNPDSGSTVGGTSITITGTGFQANATVSLGGSAASSVAVVNSTTITALTPAHTAGTVDVVVTNTDGQSGTRTGGFTYVAPQAGVPLFDRVFIVVEENQSFSNVIGSGSMPYLNALADRYGLAVNYFANTQPSIGDYFWLTTGQNITNDSNFSGTVTADNIVRQLNAAGKTWKAYAQSLPSVGYTGGDQYPYVKRHNPFAYFSDVLENPSQANNIVPFTQFTSDLANNQLPHYSFIIPNQQNNAHDCPAAIPNCTNADKLAAADTWLKTNIDPLIASAEFRQGGLLVITFDESVNADTQHGGGHIATVVISSKTPQNFESNTLYQHQSTLRLMAEALGLTSFPGAAATAPNMSEFFGATQNTAPNIGTVTPSSGPVAGGTEVTISGSGFATGATVTFGGTNASATVLGSTTINAVAPGHSSGPVNVVVTNPGGQSATVTNGYTYVSAPLPAPSVSGITPNSGPTDGGTSVTINGNNFVSGATVSIGLTPATSVNVVNSTTITATTPGHAAGTVNVQVTNPDAQSGTLVNGFTYTSPPPPGETVLVADDFNNAALDGSKWIANNLFSGFTDATVTVQETTMLQIGPLKQNVDGSHYNGIKSATAHNFVGGYAYVQLVTVPSSSTAADAFFTLGLNVDNCYRMYVEAGNLILQSKLGGAKQTLLTLAYNPANHAFWRIRHDAVSGQVVFEVAPNSGGVPGSWVQLHAQAWNTMAVPLSSVTFELKGGTWRIETNNPGTVVFDNFKAARP